MSGSSSRSLSGLTVPARRLTPESAGSSGHAMTIVGATAHNLKGINATFPLGKITVVTGVSGCGKSSLVEQTIFAEGRRRYLTAAHLQARQSRTHWPRTPVESIDHLPPTLGVFPPRRRPGPWETVGTLAELDGVLRVLFANFGTLFCANCHLPVRRPTQEEILARLMAFPERTKLLILAPVQQDVIGDPTETLLRLQKEGFVRARVNGQLVELAALAPWSETASYTVELVIDRLVVKPGVDSRFLESLATAWQIGQGWCLLSEDSSGDWRDLTLSRDLACPQCQQSYRAPVPGDLHPHSQAGACPTCQGMGRTDPDLESTVCPDCQGQRLGPLGRAIQLEGLSLPEFSQLPLRDALSAVQRWQQSETLPAAAQRFLLPELYARLSTLGKLGLGYLSGDRRAATLSQGEWQRVRLTACLSLDLAESCYLLDEPTNGLHAQDVQRVLDVLLALRDEGQTLIVVEHDLQTLGIADHVIDLGPGAGARGGQVLFEGTPAALKACVHSATGQAFAQGGKLADLQQTTEAPAVASDSAPVNWQTVSWPAFRTIHAGELRFPLGGLTAFCGVSGSGKSTLLRDLLVPQLRTRAEGTARQLATSRGGLQPVGFARCRWIEPQRGRSPRSCPATLLGIWDRVRALYARTREARLRGFSARRFSYLLADGWCERCQGRGELAIVAGDSGWTIRCPACHGGRYNPQTLSIHYRGQSIGDCLEMSVEEAAAFFASFRNLHQPLQQLAEIGLGYLKLGQPATTLSAGELQRVALARELQQADTMRAIYLLDEPTSGLHSQDIAVLYQVLRSLTQKGHTVIIAEHSLPLLAAADWLIELGPGPGEEGGRITAQGRPREAARQETPTGIALARFWA